MESYYNRADKTARTATKVRGLEWTNDKSRGGRSTGGVEAPTVAARVSLWLAQHRGYIPTVAAAPAAAASDVTRVNTGEMCARV